MQTGVHFPKQAEIILLLYLCSRMFFNFIFIRSSSFIVREVHLTSQRPHEKLTFFLACYKKVNKFALRIVNFGSSTYKTFHSTMKNSVKEGKN